jgi:hypothetical protein
LKLGYLFLIRGLILLAAAALLVPLTGFIWHLVGLTGLVSLLRWIRLILLCHSSSPGYQRALLTARATSTDRHSTGRTVAGLPSPCTRRTTGKYSDFLFKQKSKALGEFSAPRVKRK